MSPLDLEGQFFKKEIDTPGTVDNNTNIVKGEITMPTINQLVRQGRTRSVEKSKSPALGKRWNSLKKKETDQNSHKSVVFVRVLEP
jgi:hypothetical protein